MNYKINVRQWQPERTSAFSFAQGNWLGIKISTVDKYATKNIYHKNVWIMG
ncbi:hypothetical protein [Anaerobutyricum hallii]|uniref:hypothetical protein n=1 Tax=Anaerobutyricum hallii TaxID=39488 RepID=UPI0015F8FCEA|nr:hypothetical protein [Anaerobutyricum hallii]